MNALQLGLYKLFLRLYYFVLWVVSPFNPKAQLWLKQRKEHPFPIEKLDSDKEKIWFHCASLGEFDQALPVIRKFEKKSNYQILVSFYSPSGFQAVHSKSKYNQLVFFYLPQDYKSVMVKLIDKIDPKMLFIIKYELWYHLIHQVKRKNIPVYLVSAYFYEDQQYFKSLSKNFYISLLNRFDQIFLLDANSKDFLEQMGVTTPILITGDTRVEQCLKNTQEAFEDKKVEAFVKDHPIIILGSSWQEEEVLLSRIIDRLEKYKIIIAPHDISEQHLKKIENLFNNITVRYSKFFEEKNENSKIMLLDNIGMLKNIYSHARLSIIGGGFTGKLHNVLEPIAYGVPVICGPKTKRYPEAKILEDEFSLIRIEHNEHELLRAITYFEDEKNYIRGSQNAKKYILENADAAKKLLDGLNL